MQPKTAPQINNFQKPQQTVASLRSRPVSVQGFTNKRENKEANTVSNVKISSFIKGFSNEQQQQQKINCETYRQEEKTTINLSCECLKQVQVERELKIQLEKELRLKTNEIKELKEKV